ncbi:MAG: HEAT repeat domain-containing protein [Acidobacteriota bacterium]
MKSINKISLSVAILDLALSGFANSVMAQTAALQKERDMVDSSSGLPWFSIIFLVIAVLGGGAFLWWRKTRPKSEANFGYDNRLQDRKSRAASEDLDVDAEKELEWFRKAKKSSPKADQRTEDERRVSKRRLSELNSSQGLIIPNVSAAELQEKLRRLQYAQLPINSFIQLTDARPYDQLAISSDPALLSAIEQVNEEFEDDEAVRDLAVRILAAFKFRNSVESLSQVALYDVSAAVRSKAVTTLTEFDHESVFETILLACADPTREVRAAAARGLFRLSFDRAEAWKRLIATHDEFRMRQAARAAIESGILQKSLDRLLHDEMRISYEAFTLVALLIKAGELSPIFEALRDHTDERVRLALIHVLKVVKDERSLAELEEMIHDNVFSDDMLTRAKEAVKGLEPVPAGGR